MNFGAFTVIIFAIVGTTFGDTTTSPSTPPPPPPPSIFQPQAVHGGYSSYGNDAYGSMSPYANYYPGRNNYGTQESSFASSLKPVAQTALVLFTKAGLFFIGGAILLGLSALLTTAVCHFTPLCTIHFNGLAGIDKETVRSLMSPEKISTAAALVQDAIGKYQRMQRATGN